MGVDGWIAVAAAVVAVVAGLLDWRQRRRRDLDRVAPVDWRTIHLLALGLAIVAIGVAIHQ